VVDHPNDNDGRVVAWQLLKVAPQLSSDAPIDWMFSFCSHGAQRDVNGSRRSKKSDAETATLVEAEVDEAIATCGGCARSFARDPDRERVPGGPNRTIEPSNLDGLRAGADAQGTSAGHENLEVNVAGTVRSGVLSCNDYD
jgi:hypothetical protein